MPEHVQGGVPSDQAPSDLLNALHCEDFLPVGGRPTQPRSVRLRMDLFFHKGPEDVNHVTNHFFRQTW